MFDREPTMDDVLAAKAALDAQPCKATSMVVADPDGAIWLFRSDGTMDCLTRESP